MAYMSQEHKKELAPAIKAVLKKYGVKGTLAVDNYSTLVLNISEGPIDFCGNYWEVGSQKERNYLPENKEDVKYIQVNQFHTDKHFSGVSKKFFAEIIPLMNVGNYDHSDIYSDYYHVGWHISINVGRWNKPYRYTGE